jgi:general secretion pathway protein H
MTRLRAAGFTLLEMLVVLAVLALALALVAGGGAPRPAVQARAAADRVAAALRTARGQAILQDRQVTVALDAPGHALRVGRDAPLRLPPTLDLTGPPTIRFAPDGSSSGGRIVLAGGGRQIAVTVDWLTGRVSRVAGD